jgi:hypothetical protein
MKRDLAGVMAQIAQIAGLANRCRAVNEALGTQLTPEEIDALWPDETTDLLVAWMEHSRRA